MIITKYGGRLPIIWGGMYRRGCFLRNRAAFGWRRPWYDNFSDISTNSLKQLLRSPRNLLEYIHNLRYRHVQLHALSPVMFDGLVERLFFPPPVGGDEGEGEGNRDLRGRYVWLSGKTPVEEKRFFTNPHVRYGHNER
jgi:hypothetical protein